MKFDWKHELETGRFYARHNSRLVGYIQYSDVFNYFHIHFSPTNKTESARVISKAHKWLRTEWSQWLKYEQEKKYKHMKSWR
jgi:hypothetical protein